MMRTFLFTLISLAAGVTLAANVYRWVDENGVVHYSDQPHANAQKVHIEDPQTYKAAPVPAGPQGPLTPPAQPPPTYRGCAVSDPADEQSYANVDALTVRVSTDPTMLFEGDQIYLVLDGQTLNGGAPTGASYTLTPVDRGTHTVQAVIKDGRGALMCQSPPVTFHVHQSSVLNPNTRRPH